MRTFALVAWIGALILTFTVGCSKTPIPTSLPAGEVVWTIEVSDQMTFSPATFECAPGQLLLIHLINRTPPQHPAYIHSFVLLKPSVDLDIFGAEAVNASAEEEYIPASFKSSVLGHTKLAGPGENSELKLNAPAKSGSYPVVCSFPGHCMLGMRGTLVVR